MPSHFTLIHDDYNSEFYILHGLGMSMVVAFYCGCMYGQH